MLVPGVNGLCVSVLVVSVSFGCLSVGCVCVVLAALHAVVAACSELS